MGGQAEEMGVWTKESERQEGTRDRQVAETFVFFLSCVLALVFCSSFPPISLSTLHSTRPPVQNGRPNNNQVEQDGGVTHQEHQVSNFLFLM